LNEISYSLLKKRRLKSHWPVLVAARPREPSLDAMRAWLTTLIKRSMTNGELIEVVHKGRNSGICRRYGRWLVNL